MIGLQIQLEKLTEVFQTVPDDLRQHFSVDGEQGLDDSPFGKSPSLSPRFIPRTTGFSLPERPTLASSGRALTSPETSHPADWTLKLSEHLLSLMVQAEISGTASQLMAAA